NIFEISDPEVLPGNTLLWTIENEFSGATGSLPGVNSFPENSFRVSFLLKSDCKFISGSRLIFETGSSLLCGEQSNTVSKISGPLFLSDAEPAYQADIRLKDSTIDGCSDTAELIVQIATGEETSLFDEVSIQLPSGLTYIDGSCIGGLEDCNPSENNGLLSWYLPSERMELEFSFAVKGIDSLDCGRIFLPLYTTTRTNILCIEDSSSCSVKIATGESIEQLMIERPDFDIKEVKVFFDDLQTLVPGFEISLENSSVANSDSILISLYLDSDGSNDLSSPDSLLTEYVFNESVSTGQRIDLIMEKVNLPPGELCRLLFVIDEEKNCVCTGDVFPFQGEILIDSFESYTICSGDTLTIGIVEETGAKYEWSGIENLACLDCSTVTISIQNEEFGLLQENIFLTVTNDNGCQTTYEYLVNIVPKPRILSKDHLICEGEELTLLASDAESYSWEGPGITDNGLQVQILYLQESGNYIVTITDTYGCTSIDSAFVTVRPLPSVSAGEDQLVCYGPEVFLEALDTMTGNSYSWTPGFPFLELPGEAKTRVLIYQDQEYILSVFDGHCFNYDTVYLDFFDGLDFDGPEDITICSGDPVMISLPDSLNYTWVPFFSDMCLDSSCADVIFYPETSLTFEIIAVSEDQCLDTSILTVHVQEEMETEILEAGICPGDSVEWFGQFYFEEGLYCETQVNQEGCTFQSCLDVSIFAVNQLEISADVLLIDPGSSVQLEATPGFGMYLWNETSSLSCLDCPDPIASPIEDEVFVLKATDQNGCVQADSIAIGLLAQCVLDDVLIPNAFTPNKNDKNDRFRIANLNSEFWEVRVEVYDRWGKQLFEGFDNTGWDGSFEGEDVPEGVYLYIIRVDCGNGEEELFKGNVTLIR
ncbi:MAG: gliding motility-associated C-terminal domain-containing protein, partial [Bacteroidia bacterium]|nr:gliding motility-associated C-terminal domain-containing protein [Bacteroidia bacterium]